jgi:hypothetical protein
VTTDSLAGLARKVQRIEKELSDESLMRAVGMKGKQIGNSAIQSGAGGDLGLSNWRRGKPVNLGVRFDNVNPSTLEIGPRPRARGAVKVLNEGRKAGTSRKGRPVSASRGKGSWDKASTEMERELPDVARKHTQKVLRRHFS